MKFVNDLVSKGVSRAGAVEVLLGRPISQASDRVVLARLALPAAQQSLVGRSTASAPLQALRQGAASAPMTVRRAPGAISLPTAETLVVSVASGNETTWNQLLAVAMRLALDAVPADQKKILWLKAEIEKIKRQLDSTMRALANLVASPPPPAVMPAWLANIQSLQNQILRLQETLRNLLAELEALTG